MVKRKTTRSPRKPVKTTPIVVPPPPSTNGTESQKNKTFGVIWTNKINTVIRIRENGKEDQYLISTIAPFMFRVRKLSTVKLVEYHVTIKTQGFENCCSCDGFVNHGHCRHNDVINTMRQQNKI